jgi:hypothetical protein
MSSLDCLIFKIAEPNPGGLEKGLGANLNELAETQPPYPFGELCSPPSDSIYIGLRRH